jgi:phosphatidate cytidylyltransferase
MPAVIDATLLRLCATIVALLAAASAVGGVLRRRATGRELRATVDNVNARIRAWWVMAIVFMVSSLTGRTGAVLLFAAVSLLALREFVSLGPTTRADHRTLLWVFFAATPLQYFLIWRGWYGLFSVMIPVYCTALVAIRTALAGEPQRFLERTATVQWALMTCVYFVGYVPALLMLPLPGGPRANAALLFFLVLVVQSSDVLQYVWGKTLGRRRIAPHISPNKTWEGFAGGILSATAVGTSIWWATPFGPTQAAAMALLAALLGFAGGLVMSAVKRDLGVKDYGTLIAGHGGVLDRIDSLCFAAPVFFHVTRYFFALTAS